MSTHIQSSGADNTETVAALTAAASQSLVQNVGLRVMRDRIELTQAYVDSLKLKETAPAGKTLLFVAREIVVNQPGDFLSGVVFGNYNLFFIADKLDLRHGVWVLNDTAAPTATDGTGTDGAQGPSVKLLCRELYGVSAISIGQNGGPGIPGKKGKDGQRNCEFNEDTHQVECEYGPDEKGGDGGPGGNGGNGGFIMVDYVQDLVPGGFNRSSLQSVPGGGGAGGSKGIGGFGDPPGTDGKKGLDGAAGVSTPPFGGPVVESYYLNEVRGWLGADLDVWMQRRFQAADYYFRAFRPTGNTSNYLSIARDEANAIVALAPGSEWATRAAFIRDNIVNNLNVLGLPRDYTLQTPPEFLRLNKRLRDYEEPVKNFFRDATQGLLLADLTQTGVLALLKNQKGRLEDPAFVQQLQAETQAAAADKTAAATNLNTSNSRIEQLKKEIDNLEFRISTELPASDLKLSNGLTLLAGTVVVMVGTMFLPPAGAAAASALLPLAADLLGNSAMSADIKTIMGSSKDLSQALKLKVDETRPNAQGLNEFSQKYGKDKEKAEKDWKDPAAKIAFSFAKITKNLIDISNAKDPLQIELVKKYQELMAATHQQFLAQLGSSAAVFRHQAALAGEQLRLNDLARVNEAIAAVNQGDLDLRNAVITGIRNARPLRDRLLGRVFEASRALDLYTLSYAPAGAPLQSPYVDLNNPASLVAYDYGYLHPDIEADYLDQKITHTQFKGMLDAKMQTIESMGYDDTREAYKRRAGGMVGGVFTFPRNDDEHQAAITAFLALDELGRETKRFFVRIDSADIWGLRHEAKVTGLTLRLDGVKVRAPFSCKVWHYGRSQQRVLPSDKHVPPVVEQLLPQSDDPLTMRIAAGAPTTPGALTSFEGELIEDEEAEDRRIELRSWGRGVAAEWMVEIEPGTGDVDVSKLAGITLSIEYDSFEEDATPETPSLRRVEHAVGSIQPGTTAHAAFELTAPAPQGGLVVKLTNSNPAAVKVPGGVMVPAGEKTAAIPIEIAPSAAGATAWLTATGDDSTLRTTVRVPPQTKGLFDLTAASKPGYFEPVNAVAVDDTYAYATRFFAREDNPHASFAEGELVRVRHSDFKEQPPRIKLGFQPRSMAINPNPNVNCIYVVNGGQESFSLSILDRATLKEVAGSPLKLGQGPIDVAVNTRTNRVYVTNWFQRKVHVIALANPTTREHAVVAEIKADPGSQPLTGWLGLVVDEAKNLVYAARNYLSGTPNVHAVAVIDGNTNKVVRTITHPALFAPVDVALNAAGTRLYVAALGGATGASPTPLRPGVVVFDLDQATSSATFVGTIPTLSNPTAIAAHAQRNQVYVTIASGVQVIDGQTLKIVSTIPTGKFAQSVAVSATTGHFCVGDGLEGTLTRLSVPDLATITSWT